MGITVHQLVLILTKMSDRSFLGRKRDVSDQSLVEAGRDGVVEEKWLGGEPGGRGRHRRRAWPLQPAHS